MADYTYEKLKRNTVAELREIAKGLDHEAVKGYTQLNKEHLIPAVCQALGIDAHEHHRQVASGFDKAAARAKLRALKTARQAALDAHDHAKLRAIRRQRHNVNRQIRAHVR